MKRRSQVAVSLAVLLLGAALAAVLVAARPRAQQSSPPERAVPVRVIDAHPAPVRVDVEVAGTVEPVRRADLQPEVTGRVVEVAGGLEPGAEVAAGTVLVRLDDARYRAQVAAVRAEVAAAEVRLREEEAQRRIAAREWRGVELDEAAGAIALRGPHVRSARAQLDAARARLAAARRDLAATRIRAPFDAVVLERNVEVGEVVGPGTFVVSLAGIEAARVRAFVPPSQLAWIEVPGPGRTKGATVRLTQADGTVRSGYVAGVAGQVEERGRQVQLLIRVPRPLAPADGGEGPGLPMLFGTFVEGVVEGRTLDGAFDLPAAAVTGDDAVWVVGPDNRIVRRPVTVAYRGGNRVVVKGGLAEGERVLAAAPTAATEGMLVTVVPPGPGDPKPDSGTDIGGAP